MNIKFITKVLVLVVMLSSQSYGFWGSSNIDTVKNGTLNYNPNITVGEAFKKYKNFTSVTWDEVDGTNGAKLVVAKGKVTDKIVKELQTYGDLYMQYYFLVDGDNFELIQVAANNNGRLTPTATRGYPQTIEDTLRGLYENID